MSTEDQTYYVINAKPDHADGDSQLLQVKKNLVDRGLLASVYLDSKLGFAAVLDKEKAERLADRYSAVSIEVAKPNPAVFPVANPLMRPDHSPVLVFG